MSVVDTHRELSAERESTLRFAEIARALERYGETVVDIAAALSIADLRLGQFELVEQVEIPGVLPVESFLMWDPQRIRSWFVIFDTDLKLSIKLDGLDASFSAPEIVLQADQQPGEALAQFIEQVQAVLEAQGMNFR